MNIFDPHISGSLSVSGSGEISGDLRVIGAISGSFEGDGSNLYNIPSSGVTGLNLTRIADGNATASISSANGLRVNSNTEITGALKINKVSLGGNNTISAQITAAGGKYFVDGVRNPKLNFIKGLTYRFYFDDNDNHPFEFSTTNDGTHNGGATYTQGVTTNVAPFYIQIEVAENAPDTLYYFCDHHIGMGNSITTYGDALNIQADSSLISLNQSALATTGSNTFVGTELISGSLAVTGSVSISGSITLNGQAIGTGKLDETTFQAYTSSNDGRLFAIENSTGSYNTFTSSIDTRIKNKMNSENVISGSGQVDITGTSGYTTFSSSISQSISQSLLAANLYTDGQIQLTTASLNSYTSSANSRFGSIEIATSSLNAITTTSSLRLDAIETSTSSLNSFTSSINTTIKSKLNTETVISGSVQVLLTGTTGYSTFSSSISSSIGALSSSIATTTGGVSSSLGSLSSSVSTVTNDLSSSVGGLSSSVATTTSGLSSSIGSLSSSVATTTLNLKNRVDSVETSTGSLNSFTSSINTTIKDKMNADGVLSGSITFDISVIPGYSGLTSGVSSSISSSVSQLSGSLSLTVTNLSSSLTNTDESQNTRIVNLETASGSLNSFTSSINTTIKNKLNTESVISGSVQVNITGTTGYSTFSSSIATTTSGLSSSIGDLSSSVATTDLNQSNKINTLELKTGSYATTGSNIFQGNQTITGSLYVSQDLIVGGSSSIQHISSSVVNIADNIITVNAANPTLRFGGLAVVDSGSLPTVSGSMLFDSVNDQWIFVHQNQATVTSSVLLMGPQTFGNLGNESYPTTNRVLKSLNAEHVGDSNITDTGTKVSINSNTEVTGTLKVTGNITSPNITAIETSTSSLNTFTSSLLAAVELTGSNLTVKGNLLVKGTTTNVNTTTLDVDNNLINLNGTGATSAGLRVKDTTGPSQVSGSLLWDATNDYWIAGPLGSEQRLVRETEFNNAVTRIGNVETSTSSLNSFTSSINTTIKSKLNTDGVISGSVQVNHNATTNYDANQHVDHTTVSISAGSGLSGGGTIAATRTLTLDTGSVHFTSGVKSKMNTDGVISGSSQILSGTGIWSGSAQLPSGVVSGSSQVLSGTGIWSGSAQLPGGVISGSAQVISSLPVGTVSGSSQVLSGTGIWSGSAQLPAGVISGSAQVIASLPAGTVSGSSQVLAGTTIHSGSFFNGISVVSGSAQISFSGLTGLPAGLVSGSSQITGIANTQLVNAGFNIGTTGIALGRASAAQTLTGVSIDGNAATVTGGVYTSGDQTIAGVKTFSNKIVFNSAVANRPQLPGGMLGLDIGDGNFDIWGISRDYYPSHATAANAWGLRWNGDNNDFEFVGGGTNRVILDMDGGNVTATGTISGSTIYGTWNGSSIGTAYTAAKVTAVNAGTGISVDTTTGSVTVTNGGVLTLTGTANQVLINGATSSANGNITLTLPQSIGTTSTPTFGGLTVGNGVATSRGSYGVASANLILTSSASDTTGYCAIDFRSGNNYPSDGAQIIFENNASGGASERAKLTIRVENDLEDFMELRAGNITLNANTTSGGGQNPSIIFQNAGTTIASINSSGVYSGSIGGNAATVTNGVYTTGTYSDPAWITALAGSKISGTVASATTADQIDGIGFRNTASNSGVAANTLDSNGLTYVTDVDGSSSNLTGNATDGALYSQAYSSSWQHQIYGDYRTGIMYARGKNSGTWQSWKRVALSSATTFSSVTSLTFTHNLGTANLTAQVFDSNGDMFFPSNIRITSTQVIVTFASSRSGRLVVTG